MYKYFKDSEIKGLKPELVEMLDKAREIAGIPFIITSGFRTPEHSTYVGGFANDPHTTGSAVDLKLKNKNDRFLIINSWIKAGGNRFGDEVDHVHLDIDKTKEQNFCWR